MSCFHIFEDKLELLKAAAEKTLLVRHRFELPDVQSKEHQEDFKTLHRRLDVHHFHCEHWKQKISVEMKDLKAMSCASLNLQLNEC